MARKKKRADGRIVITKTYNGKRKFFYGSTKAEAESKQEAFEQAQSKNVYSSDILYDEWLDAWLEYIKNNLSAATFDSYCGVVRLHIRPALGRYKFNKITPQLILNFLQKNAKNV